MTFAPPTALTPIARYETMAAGLGGKGWFVSRPEELLPALRAAMAANVPTIVNIAIEPFGQRKPQDHDWLTRSKL